MLSSVLLTHTNLISLEKSALYSQWSNVEGNFSFLKDVSSLQITFGVKCPIWEDQTWNTDLMVFGTETALVWLGYVSVSCGVLIREMWIFLTQVPFCCPDKCVLYLLLTVDQGSAMLLCTFRWRFNISSCYSIFLRLYGWRETEGCFLSSCHTLEICRLFGGFFCGAKMGEYMGLVGALLRFYCGNDLCKVGDVQSVWMFVTGTERV